MRVIQPIDECFFHQCSCEVAHGSGMTSISGLEINFFVDFCLKGSDFVVEIFNTFPTLRQIGNRLAQRRKLSVAAVMFIESSSDLRPIVWDIRDGKPFVGFSDYLTANVTKPQQPDGLIVQLVIRINNRLYLEKPVCKVIILAVKGWQPFNRVWVF